MGSSSKRKSSKRKSSKLSSQAQRKKRSRRTKLKKLRRRDDSSSDSGDDSRNSVSISSSSSKDEYRRARSRTRSEVKGSGRKRTRTSSSSPESSEENSRHVKKRKGLKKSAKSDSKKKSRKKKRKREPCISSISSDSRSFSTSRGGSSTSGDSEFERPRARSRGESKEKRNLGKAKSGTKSNKNMSMSCSPSSRYSDGVDHNSKDIVPVENNVRRLRSVITVAKSSEREEEEKDGHKEEIAYDHDDYPSCRSNDSNEGGSKREIASLDLESKRVENVKGGEALVSDIREAKSQRSVIQDSQSNSLSDAAGTKNYSEETKVEDFPTISGASGDDLESVLRLKALENLKKYRGVRLQTNAKPPADEKTKSDSEVKRLSTAKAEFVRDGSLNLEDPRVVGATRLLGHNPRSKMGRDSSFSITSHGKGQEGKGIVTERGSARHSVICPPNKVAISGNSKKEEPSPVGESELGKSGLRQEASDTVLNQTPKANILVTENDVEKSSVETSKTVGQTGCIQDGVNNVGESSTCQPSSSLKPTLEEQIPKDQQGGQFEQKTMSVMRGGEMVEVSYKVYIPKKAPALARRHLRR
ncbi:uncharacterized protein LOC131331563 isoform X1 [Rhododendron vialii]|uniref:uncharacterized protein LOC131331563 isoform X1 n=1 Tax=Rhododendron vialii TaxID=182163 RepID=UPI00265F17AE|nr:uncharacterized protein LOC131331563 isoform X1 [Rhododendron vialii]